MSQPGAETDPRRGWTIAAAAAAGAAIALGAIWGGQSATDTAVGQGSAGGIELSVGQLRINQRISQAAVRRSNESLMLLDPVRGGDAEGWGTGQLEDGAVTGSKIAANAVTGSEIGPGAVETSDLADLAVTTSKLADGSVTESKLADASVSQAKLTPALAARLTQFATVNANGTLAAGSGGVTSTRINAGNYRVNAGRDLTLCGFTGTQREVTAAAIGFLGIEIDAVNNNQLFVRTTNQAGTTADRDFSVQITC